MFCRVNLDQQCDIGSLIGRHENMVLSASCPSGLHLHPYPLPAAVVNLCPLHQPLELHRPWTSSEALHSGASSKQIWVHYSNLCPLHRPLELHSCHSTPCIYCLLNLLSSSCVTTHGLYWCTCLQHQQSSALCQCHCFAHLNLCLLPPTHSTDWPACQQ